MLSIIRIFSIVTLSVIIFSHCDSPKRKESPSSHQSIKALNYEIISIDKKSQGCQPGSCAEVRINFSEFDKSSSPGSIINKGINRAINEILTEFVFNTKGGENTDQLIELFFDGYQDFKSNFPESQTPWHIMIDVANSYSDIEFISISVNHSSYTGGAHSNSSLDYLNFTNDGRAVNEWDYFFVSKSKIKDLAERHFRSKFDLAADESLADHGFTFENNEFQLSEQFGFSNGGLVISYRPYEIATHSEGAIVITIPFYELKGIYKFKI